MWNREQLRAIHRYFRGLQLQQARLRVTEVRQQLVERFDLRLTRRRTAKVCSHFGADIDRCWAQF